MEEMTNFGKAPSIEGFKKISFWREGSVGIITLLSPGTIDKILASEFISALSIADSDDNVHCLVITGTNFVFSKGLSVPQSLTYADLRDYYDSLKALTIFFISIEKPVFSAVNGLASNNGLSLALLSDEVFYSNNSKIALTREEPMVLLSSMTSPKKLRIEGKELKLDGIRLNDEEMMKEVLEVSEKLLRVPYHAVRKDRFRGFETVLLQEEIDFLDFYLWCENCKQRSG